MGRRRTNEWWSRTVLCCACVLRGATCVSLIHRISPGQSLPFISTTSMSGVGAQSGLGPLLLCLSLPFIIRAPRPPRPLGPHRAAAGGRADGGDGAFLAWLLRAFLSLKAAFRLDATIGPSVQRRSDGSGTRSTRSRAVPGEARLSTGLPHARLSFPAAL